MTRKEAMRRLENLALETGHKRNHYIKRALIEFLEKREVHLLGESGVRAGFVSSISPNSAERRSRYPS